MHFWGSWGECNYCISSSTVSNLLSWCLYYHFCLRLKRFTYRYFVVIYPIITSGIIFIYVTIYFITITVLQTSWHHEIITTVLLQTIYWKNNVKIFCIINKSIINFWYAWPKKSIILKGWLFIFSIIWNIVFNNYSPFHKNICIP